MSRGNGERSASTDERIRALVPVRQALRDLAANLLRIMRGSGDPHQIVKQAIVFLDEVDRHTRTVGSMPDGDDFANALAIEELAIDGAPPSERRQQRLHALQVILQGALQIAASRLQRQGVNERAGEREVESGAEILAELREEARATLAVRQARMGAKPGAKGKR